MCACGILGDGERKSAEPIAARACSDPDEVHNVHHKLVYFLALSLGMTGQFKFLLTTLGRRMSHKQIVRICKNRWRTERMYQDLKGELGLDHFEGRSFPGWHHHVSVVLCCYAFVVAERFGAFPPSAAGTRANRAAWRIARLRRQGIAVRRGAPFGRITRARRMAVSALRCSSVKTSITICRNQRPPGSLVMRWLHRNRMGMGAIGSGGSSTQSPSCLTASLIRRGGNVASKFVLASSGATPNRFGIQALNVRCGPPPLRDLVHGTRHGVADVHFDVGAHSGHRDQTNRVIVIAQSGAS